MREIIFRGKRKDTGEWVEGAYLNDRDGTFYICPAASDITYGDNGNRRRIGCWYKVDPDTVGQYVGRGDKKGKRMYEGDIVEYQGRRYSIGYYDGWAMYMLHGKTGGSNGMYTPLHECIVIGNIHDNPELLEGGGDLEE